MWWRAFKPHSQTLLSSAHCPGMQLTHTQDTSVPSLTRSSGWVWLNYSMSRRRGRTESEIWVFSEVLPSSECVPVTHNLMLLSDNQLHASASISHSNNELLLLDSFLTWAITKYCIEFSVLHRRFLLVTILYIVMCICPPLYVKS